VEVVHERCCGLDVHKASVTACVLSSQRRETRMFGTMTDELLRLAAWLQEEQVTHVAMESTGVYWKPIHNILEGGQLELLVVNARHVKAVPGRKTDVKDAEWLADLLRHGLLRASFVPDRQQRELRELVRYRRVVIEQRGDVARRIQKVLEGANIKLGDVASDVLGVSGMAMLKALVAGQADPVALADLAKKGLKRKRPQLERALLGSVGEHQRYLLGRQLRQIEFLDNEIADLSQEIEARMRPFDPAIAQLDAIWGLGRRSAETILAEIGTDMSRFPSEKHISSWARICPGQDESAGKRRSGWTGKGNRWVKSALVEAAWSAVRNKNTYYAALYQRLGQRRGKKRAIVAVAHSLLVTIYFMLRDGTVFQDLGVNYFNQRDREHITRRSVRRLESLGYHVTLTESAA
jgi:transposase